MPRLPAHDADPAARPDDQRLRREAQALRHEIAGRAASPARRGRVAIVIGLGGLVASGAIVVAGLGIDLPAAPGWTMIAQLVPTEATVGVVEGIFTLY